jgi:hypothetical protein
MASVVHSYSGRVSVGCGDMKARRSVIFALGIVFTIRAETLCPLYLQFSMFVFKDAEQLSTSSPDCFLEVPVSWFER